MALSWTVSLLLLPLLAKVEGYAVDRENNPLLTGGELRSEQNCTLYIFFDSVSHNYTQMDWWSPNHPNAYDTDHVCILDPVTTNKTARTVVTVTEDLNLASGDYIEFHNPYGSPLVISGSYSAGETFELPSLFITGNFVSDSADTDLGFWLTFTPKEVGCDMETIATYDKQAITSPRYGKANVQPGRTCEYRIETLDPTKQVRIFFKTFNVKSPSYLAVNLDGDTTYENSTVINLSNPLPDVRYLSNGNVMRILFDNVAKSKGFKIYYRQE